MWHCAEASGVKGKWGVARGLRQDEDGRVVASRSEEQQVQKCRAQHTFAQNMAFWRDRMKAIVARM